MPSSSDKWTCWAATVAGVVLLVAVGTAQAVYTEKDCRTDRERAAGKHAKCAHKAMARYYLVSYEAYKAAAADCVTKYAATWPKLQSKGEATCSSPRFQDNGNGTVKDWLTGLQWEKKTTLVGSGTSADPLDVDNTYSWSEGGGSYTAADGTAFTSFLAALNGGCFAGQCDWRLPTRSELMTIVTPVYPECTLGPCIDPVFGPTVAACYWSADPFSNAPTSAWAVDFGEGRLSSYATPHACHVRAVRAGL